MVIKLKDGFKVKANENCANDWNYLTLLRKIEKGEAGAIVDAAEQLLGGAKEVEKLVKHLEVDGTTTIDAMTEALSEIMESIKETKN